tara:strand:- start:15 stop:512 length:498 start_codon:yes stop_codon:yes gene_type:complete
MALTKIGKEGITGISNSADATFLTATSGEGVTLAGTLAVTGVHTVGTNAVATSDGGSATTSIVQGLAKMWIQFDGTGTIATRDSFNRGGLTDNGTGNYTVTFTNNMSNDDFSVAVSMNAENTDGGYGVYSGFYECNTSNCKVSGRRQNGNADTQHCGITVHGDLA